MRVARRHARASLILLALITGACTGGATARIALDGSPRVPDDEGIVTSVSLDELTLDGERTYGISDELRSFSALDLSTAPLLFSDGQYAQVGLDGDTVVWLGTLARPVGSDPAVVYFTDTVDAVEGDGPDRVLIFASGTVLHVEEQLEAPLPGALVRAEVDVSAQAVTSVTVLAAAGTGQ